MLTATDVLFGPAVVFFSVIASYTDLKEHRIKNTLIIRIFLASLALNTLFFLKTGARYLFFNYLRYLFYYAVFSLFLYFFGLWRPGDAKFFVSMASLLHPNSNSSFAFPFVAFFGICLAFVFAEAVFSKKIKFKFKFSREYLLPVFIAPLLPNFRLSFLILMAVPFLIAKKFPFVYELALPLTLLMFFIYPVNTIGILGGILLYSLLASFKFEGHMPSAPFMSLGFIATFILFP